MSQAVTITDTITQSSCTGFDDTNSTYASINTNYPLENSTSSDSSSTTYTTFNIVTGSGAETFLYYKINIINIPSTATITSATFKVKGYVSSTNSNYINTRTVQMGTLSGSTWTGKGTTQNLTNSGTVFTFNNVSWTVSELANAAICFYAKRGTSNVTTARTIRVYGMDASVSYSFEGYQYTVDVICDVPGVVCSFDQNSTVSSINLYVTTDGASTNTPLYITNSDQNIQVYTPSSGNNPPSWTHCTPSTTAVNVRYIKDDFTVYVIRDTNTFVKPNNHWKQGITAYQKTNGVWTEINMDNYFAPVQSGNNYVAPSTYEWLGDLNDACPLVKLLVNCDLVDIVGRNTDSTGILIRPLDSTNLNQTYFVLGSYNGNLCVYKCVVEDSTRTPTFTPLYVNGVSVGLNTIDFSNWGPTLCKANTSTTQSVYGGTLALLKLKEDSPYSISDFETLFSEIGMSSSVPSTTAKRNSGTSGAIYLQDTTIPLGYFVLVVYHNYMALNLITSYAPEGIQNVLGNHTSNKSLLRHYSYYSSVNRFALSTNGTSNTSAYGASIILLGMESLS